MHSVAGAIGKGLGHKRADQSHLFGVSDAAIQEDVAICGGKAVGVSVVNFKLTISILVVNLIDIKANSLQAGDQLFNVGTTAGQSLVVITRFIQGVGAIGWDCHPSSLCSRENSGSELHISVTLSPKPFNLLSKTNRVSACGCP